MERQFDLPSWKSLEERVQSLLEENEAAKQGQNGYFSHLLFRGQANHNWPLETTLDRVETDSPDLASYYRLAALAKTRIESFTSRTWGEINYIKIAQSLTNYDALGFGNLPHYDFLIYLRHHGFPSPLLDWSRSLYIAAYFAFQKPVGDRVAIYVYQEMAGVGKVGSSNLPQIHALGPNVRTHPRHFLQQGEYTLCVQYNGGKWEIGKHADVFQLDQQRQDRLWKFTIPSSEAPEVMNRLKQYNITDFSLFQSEESLLQTLSRELFQ